MNAPDKKDLGVLAVTVFFMILMIFPLYIMLKISLSGAEDIFTRNPPYLIRHFTFEHFLEMFRSGRTFYAPLIKSIVVALCSTGLSLLISVPAAYAVSKFDYRLRYGFVLLIFATRMIPEVSIALPVSIEFIEWGLFDTYAGLVLAHMVRILPVTCYILVGVFAGLPGEIEKQARIDGCSRMKALAKVVLPLSMGGISVAGIFAFLLSWDEFIYASYLTLARPTMPVKMYYYISRGDIFYSSTYAVIITIPVLVFTFMMQKYIRPDYFSGAVKG